MFAATLTVLALALRAGAPPKGGALFFPTMIGALSAWGFFSVRESDDKRKRLALTGDPCTATIVRATQGLASKRSISVNFCLRVHLSDGRDVEVEHTSAVSHLNLSRVTEGASLDVVADPRHPTILLIEW